MKDCRLSIFLLFNVFFLSNRKNHFQKRLANGNHPHYDCIIFSSNKISSRKLDNSLYLLDIANSNWNFISYYCCGFRKLRKRNIIIKLKHFTIFSSVYRNAYFVSKRFLCFIIMWYRVAQISIPYVYTDMYFACYQAFMPTWKVTFWTQTVFQFFAPLNVYALMCISEHTISSFTNSSHDILFESIFKRGRTSYYILYTYTCCFSHLSGLGT